MPSNYKLKHILPESNIIILFSKWVVKNRIRRREGKKINKKTNKKKRCYNNRRKDKKKKNKHKKEVTILSIQFMFCRAQEF